MTRSCSMDNCGRPHFARGWCAGHYDRNRRFGDPLAGGPLGNRRRQIGPCSVDGCDDPKRTGGMCSKHSRAASRVSPADPTNWPYRPTRRTAAETEAYFWVHVDKSTGTVGHLGTECWVWTRKPSANGYGQLWTSDGRRSAHVYSWELHRGPVPDGAQVDHRCHTRDCEQRTRCPHRLCVRPDHLQVITGRDNRHRGIRARPGNGGARR